MAISKKQATIYRSYGINVIDGKLETPIPGVLINPILKDNNLKLNGNKKERAADPGDNKNIVWTFGTLPTDQKFYSEKFGNVCGTCNCTCTNCNGKIACYGMSGNYRFPDVKNGMIIKTVLIRNYLNWVKSAIMAQLEIIGDNVDIRLHDTGDFDSIEYLTMWIEIIKAFPNNRFWTYTKHQEFEAAFDNLPNANIVRSIIPNCGYNFGHIGYLFQAYRYLVAIGETPYICRCGIDKNQHCYNCNNCITNKFVLFVEHSTEYKADDDPLFGHLATVLEMQQNGATVADIVDYIESING